METDKNMNKIYNDAIVSKLSRYFGISPEEATKEQMYKASVLAVRDILTTKRKEFAQKVREQKEKRVYYLCMEFLLGRSLKVNLKNLGIEDDFREFYENYGMGINEIYDMETDAGLGNGGLGRLAACFMDSLSSLSIPATGFSILYEYGMFKQKIVDGEQIELPDIWLPNDEGWLVQRQDKAVKVRFGGHVTEEWENGKCSIIYSDCEEVEAVPYDMMISGANSDAVSVLRLWRSQATLKFDMNLFSQGKYLKAVEDSTMASTISKVLYPADNHIEGKMLRLTQQYFLVSASLQTILQTHLSVYNTLDNLAEKVSIHINDTHPALAVPELMRLLLDENGYSWDDAWRITVSTLTYTNHTVMPEALECWNLDIFKLRLPRIFSIINEINERFCAQAWKKFTADWDKIGRMSIICDNQVRMANLSVIGSNKINGVSALHSEILKKTVFRDFYDMYPERFTNVTNGIAHRRWLCYSNPELAALLTECIGNGYYTNPEELKRFEEFKDDREVIKKLSQIKRNNKIRFIEDYKSKTGIELDPDSIFDVQIKRLHEYKRQLLNVLNIISIYIKLKEDPSIEMTPHTFIFGAKAASGYYHAKEIIKLINCLSAEIEKNDTIKKKLRVVFTENYNVTTAEMLIPASDISEQISLAGKEASGTSNMKFMINGSITLGTLDGANVEIREAVGDDNICIFGLTAQEVNDMWNRGYKSSVFYNRSETLRKIIDALYAGFNGESFASVVNYLLFDGQFPDPYMNFADFDEYQKAQEKLVNLYPDRSEWQKKCLVNIANAGRFAADRAIKEYADNIWHVRPVK